MMLMRVLLTACWKAGNGDVDMEENDKNQLAGKKNKGSSIKRVNNEIDR